MEEAQLIINLQYKVLSMTHELLINYGLELDKDFKKRVFKNIEHIKNIEKALVKS